jgi:hypothetical protein
MLAEDEKQLWYYETEQHEDEICMLIRATEGRLSGVQWFSRLDVSTISYLLLSAPDHP